jgi:hypothetical protein
MCCGKFENILRLYMANFTIQSLVTCTKWEEKQVRKYWSGGGERIVLEKVYVIPRSQIISDHRLTVHFPKIQEHLKVKNKTSG